MIAVTEQAARQILRSAEQSGATGMALRLAARRGDDGRFEYGLGFDERHEGDVLVSAHGIEVIVSPSCKDLLTGATLDYVELNPGESRFIVTNPNDPAHAATPAKPS